MGLAKSEKSKNTFPDRANLTPEQSARLEAWVKQVNLSSQGALKVSKSDLVNFFLETYPDLLSEEIIIQLEIRFHEEMKWLGWALTQIKKTKLNGETLTLESLLKTRVERWKNKSGVSLTHSGRYKKGAKISAGHKIEEACRVDNKADPSMNCDGESDHEEKMDNRLSTP